MELEKLIKSIKRYAGEAVLISLVLFFYIAALAFFTLKDSLSKARKELNKFVNQAVKEIREIVQKPESNIHPVLSTIAEFHVTKDRAYCNGIYIKNLLLKFLPDREPAFIVKELLSLNKNIDISFHFYPDQGAKIRKILGRHYKIIFEEQKEQRKGGSVSLTTNYQEEKVRDIYYASLGGRNLFLATILVTAYESTPRELRKTVALIKKTLRPAGLITDSLQFKQEQGFLSSIPFGMDKIKKFAAVEVDKLAEGTLPFLERQSKIQNGIPLGVELKEGV